MDVQFEGDVVKNDLNSTIQPVSRDREVVGTMKTRKRCRTTGKVIGYIGLPIS